MTKTIRERIEVAEFGPVIDLAINSSEGLALSREWHKGNLIPADEADSRVAAAERKGIRHVPPAFTYIRG